ncbi:hypothetical protein GS531_21360 [Rhodococcus hoagii]|nr:hypothetical protein [Prescottella equi]
MLQVHALLSRGIDVVVTDYQGWGTARDAQLRRPPCAGARDARRRSGCEGVAGSRIGDDNPIGFWGYSQGGGAAASAAEMQPSYAPDLDVRGTYAEWAAADLRAVAAALDGGLATGLLGYAVNIIYAGYPETRADIDGALAPAGRQAPTRLPLSAFRRRSRDMVAPHHEWTKDGRSLAETHRRAAVGERGGRRAAHRAVDAREPGADRAGAQRRQIPHTQPLDWPPTGALRARRSSSARGDPTDRTGVRRRTRPADGVGLPSALDWMTDRFDGGGAIRLLD